MFAENEDGNRNKRAEKYFEISVVVDIGCGNTKNYFGWGGRNIYEMTETDIDALFVDDEGTCRWYKGYVTSLT